PVVRGHGRVVAIGAVELARQRDQDRGMTAMLIDNAAGIFTGLPGAAMRRAGQIRIRDGVIVAIGALTPEPGEERLDAKGGVVYPGLVSTHHHLFQSVLKGVRSGIDLPLAGW